jgi:hypothetical protein
MNLIIFISRKSIIHIIAGISILLLFTGCTTTKYLSYHETAKNRYQKSDFLIISVRDRQFLLHNFTFLEDYLEGDLTLNFDYYYKGTFVYAEIEDSILSHGDFPKHIRIKIENIEKISKNEPNGFMTVAAIIGIPFAGWCIYWGVRIIFILLAFS